MLLLVSSCATLRARQVMRCAKTEHHGGEAKEFC